MKRIFFTLFFTSSVLCLYAQYTTRHIPMYSGGPTIEVLEYTSADILDKTYWRNALIDPNGEFSYLGLQASDIIGDATRTYNCHAYAWHHKGIVLSPVWINDPSPYWGSIGCYVEVPTESQADIIFYRSENNPEREHSALPSSGNKYVSKWGSLPLVRHSPTQVPTGYDTSDLRYYRHADNISILGPDNVGSLETYQLSDGQANSWRIYPEKTGFSVSSNGMVSVSASVTAGATATLQAKVGSKYISKTIKAGHRVDFNLNGAPGTAPQSQYVKNNEYASATTPSWVGSIFKGWFTTPAVTGSAINFSSYPITSNQTFYAKFEKTPFGIDFTFTNNSSFNIASIYVGLTGKLGNIETVFISSDLGDVKSGSSIGLPYCGGADISAPQGTVITDLSLDLWACTYNNTSHLYEVIVSAWISGSVRDNYAYLDLDSSSLTIPLTYSTSSVPSTGRLMLNIKVTDFNNGRSAKSPDDMNISPDSLLNKSLQIIPK